MLVTQSCLTLCDLIDYSLQGSSVMKFFRQEHWSGLPFPSQEWMGSEIFPIFISYITPKQKKQTNSDKNSTDSNTDAYKGTDSLIE